MMPPFVDHESKRVPSGKLCHGLVTVTIWEDEPGQFGATFGTRANITDRPLTEHEARAAVVVFLRQLAADAAHAARMIERGGPV
jgi:hypothetical protein